MYVGKASFAVAVAQFFSKKLNFCLQKLTSVICEALAAVIVCAKFPTFFPSTVMQCRAVCTSDGGKCNGVCKLAQRVTENSDFRFLCEKLSLKSPQPGLGQLSKFSSSTKAELVSKRSRSELLSMSDC